MNFYGDWRELPRTQEDIISERKTGIKYLARRTHKKRHKFEFFSRFRWYWESFDERVPRFIKQKYHNCLINYVVSKGSIFLLLSLHSATLLLRRNREWIRQLFRHCLTMLDDVFSFLFNFYCKQNYVILRRREERRRRVRQVHKRTNTDYKNFKKKIFFVNLRKLFFVVFPFSAEFVT